ncbi:MAG: heme NO-binding domain-containing protein [Bacteroidota bacterium]|jgi:predicted hydrocarbon binding protein
MYGLVNQAIQGLVVENFGADTWEKIKSKAGVDEEAFLSNKIYDDSITYNLAGAAAQTLGISVGEVLHAFGKYWVLKVGNQKYGTLMRSGGDSLMEFLLNLPNFHSRVMLIYSDIRPPEFKIEQKDPRRVLVHYYSSREGLTDFMSGLISGLAELYQTEAQISCVESRANGHDHDVFEVVIS